eukprot:Hpha_TRINITY_DN29783_c0_g1::TRINITY_DN29783_c0_g1_i1::g.2573::m.2573
MGASVKRRVILFAVSLFITVTYLCIGAIVMRQIERPTEDANIEEGAKEVDHLIKDLNMTQKDMDTLEATGICNFHKTPNWTLTGALFFTLTVITTIGYGSFAPATQAGRSFTAFYAIIGIGIIGQMLASCAVLIKGIIAGIAERFKDNRRNSDKTPEEENEEWEIEYHNLFSQETGMLPAANLQPFLELITGGGVDPGIAAHLINTVDPEGTGRITPAQAVRATSLWYRIQSELPRGVSLKEGMFSVGSAGTWICLWAFVFMFIEGWTYRECVWFCFVSMSTIGFGDFTPQTHAGRMMSFLFIVPGLGMGAAALGSLWDAFDSRRYWWLQRRYATGKASRKLLEAHGMEFVISHPDKCQVRRDYYVGKQGNLSEFMGGGSGIGPGMIRSKQQNMIRDGREPSVVMDTQDPGYATYERNDSDGQSNVSSIRGGRDPYAYPRSPQLPVSGRGKRAGPRYLSLGDGFSEGVSAYDDGNELDLAGSQYSRLDETGRAPGRRKKTIISPHGESNTSLPPLGGLHSNRRRSGAPSFPYTESGESSPRLALSMRSDAARSSVRGSRKGGPGVIPGGSVRVGPGAPRVVTHRGGAGPVTNGSGLNPSPRGRTGTLSYETHAF